MGFLLSRISLFFLALAVPVLADEIPWFIVTQTNRVKDLWETRVMIDGNYEAFFRTSTGDDSDEWGTLLHCGRIPPNELEEMKQKVEGMRRQSNGKVEQGYGPGKWPPEALYYNGKFQDPWKGERARELAAIVEDVTHPDTDMGLSFTAVEWVKKSGERWTISRNGSFFRTSLVKGVAAKDEETPVREVGKTEGPICREELRALRRRINDIAQELAKAKCKAKLGESYVELEITVKGKTKAYACNGKVEELPTAFRTAVGLLKTTTFRTKPVTK